MADTAKKTPVIVVKKKRQFTLTPVTENVVPAPDAEKKTTPVTEAPALKKQLPPSGLNKKQRKYLRRKQERRDILRNGRQKLPLFRQLFPLLWPEDNAFRPIKVGILSDVEVFINENPGCGLSLHDCRCVLSWVTGRLTYLCLFSHGAVRYDLDGVPSGTVSDRDVFYARQTTERILSFLARKTAEAQQTVASADRNEKNDGVILPSLLYDTGRSG